MEDRILANRYSLESEIGRGGMGVVYKATDTQVKRTVAVKTLPAVMSHNQDLMRRFKSEVQHASRLEHPNIVRVYDVGEDEGTHFYVMQYIDGPDLRSRMKSKGRCSVDETISIISQVADALDYAHSQGIVHRDIKPENILLDSDGVAHVVDFGIAKATEGTRTTRGMLGTPEYMSPEQVKGKSVDGRSDQYSLAVVAYEMLTGRTPFKTEGDDPWAQINMHLNTPVPNPQTTVPDLPTPAADALLQALAKKPEQRFCSCGEFVQAFKGEMESTTSRRSAGSITTTLRRARIVAVSGCLLAAIAAFAWLTFNSLRSHDQRPRLRVPPIKMVDQVACISVQDQISRVIAMTPGTRARGSIGQPFRLGTDLYANSQSVLDARISRDGRTAVVSWARSVAKEINCSVGQYEPEYNADLYIIRENQEPKKIASGTRIDVGDISADGKELVFSDGNIHVVRVSDLRRTTLTNSNQARTPSFSDRGQIAYVDQGFICLADRDGSEIRRLTRDNGDYSAPTLSSDTGKLAFIAGKDVFLIDQNGQTRVLLQHNPHTMDKMVDGPGDATYEMLGSYYRTVPCERDRLSHPAFSPDGSKVAVVESCAERMTSTLHIIDTLTGKRSSYSRLSRDRRLLDIGSPAFGPKGDAIAFDAQADDSDEHSIVLADLSSGDLRVLSHGVKPSWVRRSAAAVLAETTSNQARPIVPEGLAGQFVQVSADFDGDGKPEMAGHGLKESDSHAEVVWLAKGGTIGWKNDSGLGTVTGFAAKDLTGDGRPELLYTCETYGGSGGSKDYYAYTWNKDGFKRIVDAGGSEESGLVIVAAPGRPASLILYDYVWASGEAHADPHTWIAQGFRWDGTKFVGAEKRMTANKYCRGDGAALRELGVAYTKGGERL